MGDHVVVNVAQGALRGKKGSTQSGGPLVSFQGVPFAKPPVGPLRFKTPQPLESWTGVRDALQEGPVCLQMDEIQGGIRGEEDCLYLNVYTQELQNSSSALKPVMVWIHGGGFYLGSGNRELYGVDYFVDSGVVAVTINYRLGVFGFLTLESSFVPGNMGLKDQVTALRWIKQNITNFGGDPKNITIFGESAGGASVHFLLLSPMSKGLFSKAIAQSGSALNPWPLTRSGRARAFKLSEVMGFKTRDSQALLNHLMSADGESIVRASLKILSEKEKLGGLQLPFVPCIEPVVPGQGGFLTREPSAIIKEGKFHKVPFIAGVTTHEGMLFIRDVINDPSLFSIIDGDFQNLLPAALAINKNKQQLQVLADKIKKFYFGNKPISEDTLMDYVHLKTDLEFLYGVERMVFQQSALSSAPVYCYQFAFDGNLGYVKKFVGATDLPGACHGDELGYLFTSELFDIDVDHDSPEGKVHRSLVKMWSNFAKTGNPTPELDADVTVKWTPYTPSNPCYLKIDSQLTMENELEKKRIAFWNGLYQSKL